MPELPKVNPQFGGGMPRDGGDPVRGPYAPPGSAHLRNVRAGDAYPAGLKELDLQPVAPPQDGTPEPAGEGRCNFVLEIRGTCLDTPGARQAVRKAVELALGAVELASGDMPGFAPGSLPSYRVAEATVEVGAVVMRS